MGRYRHQDAPLQDRYNFFCYTSWNSVALVKRVHIIGGGLAGLSAAVRLAEAGIELFIHEASGNLGGRCRSYYDSRLGEVIDNGNHLVLSGNQSVEDYLQTTDAIDTMWSPKKPEFPFFDLATGDRWTVQPNIYSILNMFLRGERLVPGSSLAEYLRVIRLVFAKRKTVTQCLDGPGPVFSKFWAPLAISILNTETKNASAGLFWSVIKETFIKGGGSSRPMIAANNLSDSFVDPAIRYIEQRNGRIFYKRRVKYLEFGKSRITGFYHSGEIHRVNDDEGVILALPIDAAQTLLPNLIAPTEFRPIVNGHFVVPQVFETPFFIGLVGGVSDWIFGKNNLVSVTKSAATSLVNVGEGDIAQTFWREICVALGFGDMDLGSYRIIKEKRATFMQSPEQLLRRPDSVTNWTNLALAGDWIQTHLPATIEGSLMSGEIASRYFLK